MHVSQLFSRISYTKPAAGSSIMVCVMCVSVCVCVYVCTCAELTARSAKSEKMCYTECLLTDGDDLHLPLKQCPLCVSLGVCVCMSLLICVRVCAC